MWSWVPAGWGRPCRGGRAGSRRRRRRRRCQKCWGGESGRGREKGTSRAGRGWRRFCIITAKQGPRERERGKKKRHALQRRRGVRARAEQPGHLQYLLLCQARAAQPGQVRSPSHKLVLGEVTPSLRDGRRQGIRGTAINWLSAMDGQGANTWPAPSVRVRRLRGTGPSHARLASHDISSLAGGGVVTYVIM